jgi:hypothetical protein
MMVKKKISSNLYLRNVKTDFLSPKVSSMKRVKTTTTPFIISTKLKNSQTTPFMVGTIHNQRLKASQNINFFPVQKKSGAKQTSSVSFIPKKSPKFVPTQQFLSPYSSKTSKKVKRIDMNWIQAKQKNTRLNPWGDADKDGVINMFDCHPYDPNREGFFQNVGKAASQAAAAVAKAVAPAAKAVTKAVTTTYTNIDKSIGGVLPGGAPVSAPVAKAATAVVKAATTPAVNVAKAVSSGYTAVDRAVGGGLPGGAPVSATTPAVSIASTVSKGYTALDKAVGGILPGGAPVSISLTPSVTTPAKVSIIPNIVPSIVTPTKPTAVLKPIVSVPTISQKVSGAYTALDIALGGILPGGVPSGGAKAGGAGGGGGGGRATPTPVIDIKTPKDAFTPGRTWESIKKENAPSYLTTTPTYDSTTGVYTDAYGNKSSMEKAPKGATLVGGGGTTYIKSVQIEKVGKEKKKELPEEETVYDYYYPPSEEYIEPEPEYITAPPSTIKDVQAYLQPITQRILRPEYEKALPQIAGAVEIEPEQLPFVTADKYAKYPLILNINPMDRRRPAFITSALMKLQPRITYNRDIPTRLSIIAPTGTAKEIAMTNIGAPGGKYVEYVIKMPTA